MIFRKLLYQNFIKYRPFSSEALQKIQAPASPSLQAEANNRKSNANSFTGLNELNYSTRPMDELFPVIASLLEMRDFAKADQLVDFCRNKRPQDWFRALNGPSIPNMLFKAAMDCYSFGSLSEKQLTRRFQVFSNELNLFSSSSSSLQSKAYAALKPDILTFALIVKYAMTLANQKCTNPADDLEMIFAESEFHGIDLADLLNYLQESAILEPYQVVAAENIAKLKISQRIVEENLIDSSERLVPISKLSSPLPEVRVISSKSEGISFVKDSLRQLHRLDSNLINDSSLMYNLQFRLEQDCYSAMIAKLRREAESLAEVQGNGNISNIRKELVSWHDALTSQLQAEFNGRVLLHDDIAASTGDSSYYLALLSTLDAEKISIIVLQELLKLSLYEPFFASPEGSASVSHPHTNHHPISIKAARMVTLATNIGSALQREIFSVQISRKNFLNRAQLNPLQLAKIFDRKRTLDRSMRQIYAKLEGDLEAQREGWIPSWTNSLRAEIGSYLLAVVERTLKYSRAVDGRSEGVFQHAVVFTGNSRKLGVIRIADEVFDRLRADRNFAFVEAWAMPMIVPPRPWLTLSSGGYLTHKNTCVRLKDDPVHLALLADSQKDGQLEQVLMGLDVLGRVGWRINEDILRLAIELWNQGVNVSEMTPISPDASASDQQLFPYMKREDFATVEEYREYCRKAVDFRNEQTRQHSMTCDTNYKLEIARTFAGVPFYLPHSVDFRGRAYPIPPHLSHIGSDLSRGLLQFAQGRPLGARGLFWLKVQFSNMCGNDKCSLEDRVAFADRHLAEIQESARKPLDPKAFWRSTDEPWQCLATCLEINAAISSGSPETYISRLPVQQDGSCNGSQHYAALGGDVEGAHQVNLTPCPSPQDIYGTVAQIVSREIDRDVEKFAAIPTSLRDEEEALTARVAALLQGRVGRKIVKQPVMTNIYGVTLYGAKKQIEARLKEFNLIPGNDETLMRRAREYLTHKVFGALDELFVKARQIQDWLEYCAAEICRSVSTPVALRYGLKTMADPGSVQQNSKPNFVDDNDPRIDQLRKINASTWNPCKYFTENTATPATGSNGNGAIGDNQLNLQVDPTDRYPQTPVTWSTPLAFKVLQPYLKSSVVQCRTVLQHCSLHQSTIFDAVDASKQVAAFPPNFIHSLDATHMFKTALACYEAEVTFASVHDCFWTHAASVDDMNRILREEFVAMHREPILHRLREEFLASYRDYKVPVIVKSDSQGRTKAWRNIYIPPLPERGEFDLNQVLESQYFFS